jgi:hypothetical protein
LIRAIEYFYHTTILAWYRKLDLNALTRLDGIGREVVWFDEETTFNHDAANPGFQEVAIGRLGPR